MGKASEWLRGFLTGKKDKEKDKDKEKEKCSGDHNSPTVIEHPTTPLSSRQTTPKEKRRWSFRRSSAAAATPRDLNCSESNGTTLTVTQIVFDAENEQQKHALAVAAATAAAADAAVAAAQAAAAVIRLTAAANGKSCAIEEAAAIKIQSLFRSYLARKALSALKGLVKLQALVRGRLVRKQATATLRCMQALVTAQARARAQRIRMAEDAKHVYQRQSTPRRSTQENRFRHAYHDTEGGMEESIKIVEMDLGESKGSLKNRIGYNQQAEHRFSALYSSHNAHSKHDNYHVSPAQSAMTEMSPRACSSHFEDYSFCTVQTSPHYYSEISKPDPCGVPFSFPRSEYAESVNYDYPLFPNYMANTESSKAKVRSQSAPKARPESFERQHSRRRSSMEGRNFPRGVRMQRSSSHVGSTAQNYQYPWKIKLDKSSVSLKESECGSTCPVLTNSNCGPSIVDYVAHGNRY